MKSVGSHGTGCSQQLKANRAFRELNVVNSQKPAPAGAMDCQPSTIKQY